MADTTQLLLAARAGDESAFDRLFDHVYDELHRLARAQMRRKAGHTLQTTELVHEAYLQLFGDRQLSVQDRVHFLSLAARVMRQVLVEHFRLRSAEKRGGAVAHDPLDEELLAVGDGEGPGASVLAIDQALHRLSRRDERLGRLVEYKFFGGMTEPEIATALGLSVRTVSTDWRRAKAWLTVALSDGTIDL